MAMQLEPETNGRAPALTQRVLICEDESLTVLTLRAAVRQLGFQVVGEAGDGEEAIRLARDLQPDLILMDVNMPRLNGIIATQRITAERRTAVVMLTAYSDPVTIQHALHAGAAGYVVKPVRTEQLGPTMALALIRTAQLQRSEQAAATLQAANARLQDLHGRERLLQQEAGRQAAEALQQADEYRRRWRQEQEVAHTLAESVLCVPPRIPGLEIATRYAPAGDVSTVGGDLLDFLRLNETLLGIVIADLCGHGVEAAAHLSRARFMLHAYAAEDPAPARTVARLNRALCGFSTEDHPFLTLLYGVLDLSTYSFTYCSAGHPQPLLVYPGEQPQMLVSTGGLVGALGDMEFSEETLSLMPGATLVLFTDGVVEARADGDMLGHEGVMEVIASHPDVDAARLAGAILERARAQARNRPLDDIAIVAIKRRV